MIYDYSKRKINEHLLFEASNQEFLMFVIKYLSDDKVNWQNEWVYDGRYRKHSKCVCGKEGIETVFVVRNEVTNNILSPIGSVCIKHFSHNIMQQIKDSLNPTLFDLLSRNSDNEDRMLAMSTKFFKKKDIKSILDAGVISEDEYKICLKALNKRSATLDEFRQANDILVEKIVPALRKSINAAVASSTAQTNDVYFDEDVRKYFEGIFAFSKQQHLDSEDIEAFFGSLVRNNVSTDEQNESINDRKKEQYNEFVIIDSVHRNFYEARIGSKADKKYLVIENHLIELEDGTKDYSSDPLEVNVFELKPEIDHVDEVIIDDDFDNDFADLPDPSFVCTICDKKHLKQFFKNINI